MSLLFSAEARRQFDPVAQRSDLVCVDSTERTVRYENEIVFLIVNLDNDRSYELGVEIGKRDARFPGPPFSLAEVLRLRGVEDTISVNALIVSDETRLRTGLARLADLTARYASDLLMGSDFSFMQVAKLRDIESAELWLASQLRFARSTSETAWAMRDYQGVIKALEPVELHLSPAEKKRLDYSRKQFPPSASKP